MATDAPGPAARWRDWWTVGCGVESLHAVLTGCGLDVELDEVLAEALALDGYDDALGWRHHALVAVAARHGVCGAVVAGLTATDLEEAGVWWLVSVRAPEQFASTHLVAVRRLDASDTDDASYDAGGPGGRVRLEVTWPQGQLEHGRVFVTTPGWIAPRMTGRGMRFDARV